MPRLRGSGASRHGTPVVSEVMSRRYNLLSLSLAAAWLGIVAGPTLALPLPAETCRGLEEESSRLEQQGVRDDLVKGAAWGRANLSREGLERVRRLIELDEQLAFRCVGRKPLYVLKEDIPEEPPRPEDQDPAAGPPPAAAGGAKAVAPKAEKPPARKAQRKAAAPAASDAATAPATSPAPPAAKRKKAAAAPGKEAAGTGESAGDPTGGKAAAPPKPKSRPKVNDAYVPKPPDAAKAVE